MTYVLQIRTLNVGPFNSHAEAQIWAEKQGIDNYEMLQVLDCKAAKTKLNYKHLYLVT
jgi:hypothetical protein